MRKLELLTGHEMDKKSLSHKTKTDHPFDSNCRCNVYLSLGLDSFGLYLLGNARCAQHNMHPTEADEQFQWFPFVIKIDITLGTKKYRHPFLNVTGKNLLIAKSSQFSVALFQMSKDGYYDIGGSCYVHFQNFSAKASHVV
jgi:hypothetical protein